MKKLHVGAASLALVCASPALAQTAPEDREAPPAALSQADVGKQVGVPAEADGIDIVVTALKHSERLVDIPVSISSVSADNLATAGRTAL